MYTKWTEHLNTEQSERFKNHILGSRDILERLTDILNERERDMDLQELSLDNYNQPNWAERQAHMNGFRSCLHYVKKLIDLDQQSRSNNDR